MLKYACVCLLLCCPLAAHSQLTEDFSDGNLSVAPPWSGDTDSFRIDQNGWLQLDALTAGTATIFTQVLFPDSIEWAFDVMTTFEPSSSNQLQVILMSDTGDLAIGSGYILKIGESGAPDPLCLHAVESGEMFLLGCSEDFYMPGQPLHLQIQYKPSGSWIVAAKQEDAYHREVMRLEETIETSRYSIFGVSCTYTSSRSRHFFFDNFLISSVRPDTVGPSIISTIIRDARHIDILFDETINIASTVNSLAITGAPNSGHLLSVEENHIEITLENPLISGDRFSLSCTSITDESGNVMRDTTIQLIYWESGLPSPGDVLITEILPDPDPPIGLGEYEFIELHNPGTVAISTDSILLLINDVATPLGSTIIPPGAFAVISEAPKSKDTSHVEINLSQMPKLKNSDGNAAISNAGVTIHSMRYSEDDYDKTGLDSDGRSLELNNIDAPCLIRDGWFASHHLSGGTPGSHNSIAKTIPVEPPQIDFYYVDGDYLSVVFHFNRLLSDAFAPVINITPTAPVGSVEVAGNTVKMLLAAPLDEDRDYTITVSNLLDCTGRQISITPFDIITPPLVSDPHLVINEILFDPDQGCPPFLEILNYSGQSFNADQLAVTGDFGTVPIDIKRTLPPDDLMVITTGPSTLAHFFQSHNSASIHRFNLKSPDRDKDMLVLHTRQGIVLDSAEYSENFHHPALINTKGVSLERLSPLVNGRNPGAWQSASEQSGWATPGLPNSQSHFHPDAINGILDLKPDIFSPDGDGFDDQLVVELDSATSGSILTARILDINGQELRMLDNYLLAGSATYIIWDGTDRTGQVLRPGIYLLHLELIGSDGRSEYYKQPVVLAGRK